MGALDSVSNLFIPKTTDGSIEYLSSSPIEVIISTPDFASDTQVATVVGEASDLYHLRTDLEEKVFNFNEQLIQAELSLESIIEDIQAYDKLDSQSKFDYITRLKSTITLLGEPEYEDAIGT